jgi:hypothetical protein
VNLSILIFLAAVAVQAQEKANADSVLFQEFSQRIASYVKLHSTARSEVHGLKQTDSQQAIQDYEHRLARRIREVRDGVGQGNIFTTDIAAGFRRLIGITMDSPEGARIRTSLQSGSPVLLKELRVDRPYPSGVPLQTTPPSLLLNLPPLPQDLEYRLVGHTLILRDVDANLIVDFIPDAIH